MVQLSQEANSVSNAITDSSAVRFRCVLLYTVVELNETGVSDAFAVLQTFAAPTCSLQF